MANPKNKVELPSQGNKKNLFIAISVVAILVSIIYSYKLKWLGDDIFIALRYVQNFIAGNGLVYNIGERVEGFTDFLWLMLISLFSKFHFNPLTTTQVLGILSSVGTLILCTIIGYKLSKKNNVFILPFITIALALNYDYNVWATSGLETSFFTLLLCASFYIFFFSEYKENIKLMLSGLFLILAMMTRPDALLITFGVNGLLVLNQLLNKTKLLKIS